MQRGEGHDIVETLLARLDERGAPHGTWLLDIEIIRRDLRDAHERADSLLSRLEEALIEQYRHGG